uniref:Acyltransferase 3 domain-containing protein n=1 Tax=Paramoeba aestuarina TaxID=180227 RepID=A0A7S4ULK5_9EUKA|mmetsp:Transcript_3888/g.5948  ORF Transcript_3888/g.5948 Transcript_3888/m.5948 type:complete len:745 (+) Transcript_3888:1-2235(+)
MTQKPCLFFLSLLLFVTASTCTKSWQLQSPYMSESDVQDELVANYNIYYNNDINNHARQQIAVAKCLSGMSAKNYDATGRLPSGILNGNMDAQGQFDECYEGGGYYTMVFGLFNIVPLASSVINIPEIPTVLRWGMCLPRNCDVPKFVEEGGIQIVSGTVSGGAYYFQSVATLKVTMSDDEPLSGGAVAFIVVISFICFLVVLGSTYDYFYVRHSDYFFGEGEKRGGGEVVPLISAEEEESNMERGKFQEIDEEEISRDGEREREEGKGEEDVIYYQRNWGKTFKDMGVASLLGFSIFISFAEFTKMKIHPQTAALDGFRVFAILWVVIGHTYIFLMYSGITNILDLGELRGRFLFQFVNNGTFSVDVFFVMSGFLMSLLMIKSLVKSGGKMQWGLILFHRWWRLSPLYYLTVFYAATLYFYMVVGPFAQVMNVSKPCSEEWYWNLLYLNNFLPEGGNQCIAWVWYLALDMQFFLLCVPIIYILFRWPRVGLGVIAVLSIASYIATMCICINKGYTINDFLLKLAGGDNDDPLNDVDSNGVDIYSDGFDNTGDNEDKNYPQDIYDAPWARVHPYFIGIIAGYIAYLYPKTFKMKLWQQCSAFLVSFFLFCFPIYISYVENWSEAASVIYITFSRTVFGLGMAGFILLCYTGNGGFINWFFSWPIFNILSKLTYACYMFHLVVMLIYFYSFRYLPYLNDMNAIMYFLAISVMTFVIAFAAHLVIELPFAALEKAILTPLMGGEKK